MLIIMILHLINGAGERSWRWMLQVLGGWDQLHLVWGYGCLWKGAFWRNHLEIKSKPRRGCFPNKKLGGWLLSRAQDSETDGVADRACWAWGGVLWSKVPTTMVFTIIKWWWLIIKGMVAGTFRHWPRRNLGVDSLISGGQTYHLFIQPIFVKCHAFRLQDAFLDIIGSFDEIV